MYDYISGYIDSLTPTQVVMDNGGIGYDIKISLNTFSALEEKKELKLFVYQHVREDALLLYGFFTKEERVLFLLLISVSGVGANTAQVMLSSLSVQEIENAILSGDVATLKSIKGIGSKTAQRIIVDLKDKIGKQKDENFSFLISQENTAFEEAHAALSNLGFAKKQIEKTLKGILKTDESLTVEKLIKEALKQL
jgi:Holliday junction DNA helicase RuvA